MFPSKVEVMGWNPQSLADYMRKLKLTGCDKVVIKNSTTGAEFLKMTECDLQVFPTIYLPIIIKIQTEIKKGEKRTLCPDSKAHTYPKQVCTQDKEVWDSNECESETCQVCQGLDEEEGDEAYVYAMIEPETPQQQEKTALPDTVKSHLRLKEVKLQASHSRDPVFDPPPAERMPKPPCPPRINHTAQRRLKTPASQPNLQIGRNKKPAQLGPSQKDLPKLNGSAVIAPGSSISRHHPPMPPKHDVSKRTTKFTPTPPVLTQPVNTVPESRKCTPGLDPSWYGGKVARHQAEVALREVNKDGAFVVRDSSKVSAEHPYTLMLLKQGKVYNIKIRNQGNTYSLGNSLNNTKNFPGVKEMITHHTHFPLLLVDATDQSSEAQSQCCLLHPAGLDTYQHQA